MRNLLAKQPVPVRNNENSVWYYVISDLIRAQKSPKNPIPQKYYQQIIADCEARKEQGEKDYGTPLQIHNGRDFLADAYQEALDLMVYLGGKYQEVREDDEEAADLLAAVYSLSMTTVIMIREYDDEFGDKDD